MNYQLGNGYSVILISVSHNAPYRDRLEDDGSTLVYEGHDVQRCAEILDPKSVDQREFNPTGTLTENGKFHKAAQDYKKGLRPPEKVRVYEKIRPVIWSYNGVFELVDFWREFDGQRKVFKFKLIAVEESTSDNGQTETIVRRRVIPTSVKVEVWKRDGGRCVICSATDELHYDHIIPYSKGGTSLKAENIQLLCARHNLEKRDKIE
ncbi:HNH endonuclease [Chloroflexus aggregans]|uniref:HNH endonuclease n=1 Tax=Chloroflexus aggregans (strain MD-66 / DSM 9485) TaxID=326427 RepID=B8G3L9_CHLAD|nr:HNH endonuclease signature motif containing protein [Chloroflexus aggregans]ACL23402.1 HNH endonuclease [Chloroflexus aggregans DSM 9485]